jgi:SAM-dependent methyltransferase
MTPPSSTLLKFADYFTSVPSRPVLDVGCGYGRNAVALALRGLDIVCADSDADRLSTLAALAPAYFARHKFPDTEPGRIQIACTAVSPSTWSFPQDAFSSIVCVQFPEPESLIDAFRRSLVRGGYLYIETFGGHGENYLDLPLAGHLRRVLIDCYQFVIYREKAVGPRGCGRVSAQLLARKL